MKTASRLQNGVSRLAFLGFSSVLAYAFLEEFISPFIPLIITVLASLISGFLVRAIFVQLLNKRLFSAYRYTSADTNRQTTQNRADSYATSNERANSERINRADPFSPPDSLSLYRNLLGLGPRFTSEELKAAYRGCAAMYHPDRYASSSRDERQNAEDLMKKVNEAYERLKPAAL
jgi:hypothetical protein